MSDKDNLFNFKEKDIAYIEEEPFKSTVSFTQEELKAVSNVKEAKDIDIILNSYELEEGYLVKVSIKGKVTLIDDMTDKKIIYPIDVEDYLNLGFEEKEDTDVVINKYKTFNLYPAILAIFYQSIPLKVNFHSKYVSTPDYDFISEDEYNKRKSSSSNNPFSKLKDINFDK